MLGVTHMSDEPDVFLSYARKDAPSVTDLYQRLSASGLKVWMDTQNILPGQRWDYEIAQALKRSKIVIICLSNNSVAKRGVVQRELRTALRYLEEKLDSDIFLIPVRLDNCVVPDGLSHLQYVDWFERDGWDRLLQAIQLSLKQSSNEKADSSRRVQPLVERNARDREIYITSPADHSEVDAQVLVTGYVHDHSANVCVVVHPLEGSAFWIQPQASVGEDCTWKVVVYCGRQNMIDAGKHFEIRAVANPNLAIHEGMVLDQWPSAKHISQVIRVTRRLDELPQTDVGRSVSTGSVNHGIIITGDRNVVTTLHDESPFDQKRGKRKQNGE
jgi:hypothetical protein